MQWHERLKRPLAGSQLDAYLADAADLFALAVDGSRSVIILGQTLLFNR